MLTREQTRELIMDGSVQDIYMECYLSTALFAQVFFPRRFYRSFSKHHEAIFEALDDKSVKKLLVLAFRGMGKTSILQLAYPAKQILYRESEYIVAVEKSATMAESQTQNLKRALRSNDLIRKIFGDVKSTSIDNDFSKEIWRAQLSPDEPGTFILPRGARQQVRGILGEDSRPDLILVDDLEDSKEVRSEVQRASLKEWFDNDLMNVVDAGLKIEAELKGYKIPDWRAIVLGTLLHEDALLQNLSDNPEWTTIEIPLCDSKYKSCWPSYMSDEMVAAEVETARKSDNLEGFYRERMNLCVPVEGASFQSAYFKYFDPSKTTWSERIVICDPAKTTKMSSADTAILGIGIEVMKNSYGVIDIEHGKFLPDEVVDNTFTMAYILRTNVIAVEVTGLEEWIIHYFENEASKRGLNFEFIWLKSPKVVGAKETRVKGLVPYYKRGYILHNKAVCEILEQQLMSFPKSKLWDVMDGLGYLPQILEEGNRYFQPFMEVVDEEAEEAALKQMMLEDEEPIEYDWMEALNANDY